MFKIDPSLFIFSSLVALVGLMWSALWCVLSSSTPAGNRYISETEKLYIEDKLAEGGVYITGPRVN